MLMRQIGGYRSVAVVLMLASWLAAAGPDRLLEWNELMLDAIRADNTGPTLSTRNLAMLNVACHDGVQAVVRTHQPWRFVLPADPDLPLEAVVASAAFETLYFLYPSFRARAQALYVAQLEQLPATDPVIESLALGRDVAFRVLNARSADGSNTEVPYIPSAEPGAWRRTPPFYRPPLTPHWRYVRTFCLPELEPFVSPPPPSLDSVEYARDVNEVRLIGSRHSAVRTPEQSEIAVFWSDFSYTAMPPGHWHEIATGIARDRETSLADTARLFAWLSLAQADTAIVCWETKYRYNFWRPVTAIQRADEDDNPLTDADPFWDHFLAAPPFPAYTSGHSSFSRAAAQVLTHFYGTDAIRFSARSDSMPGVVRTFESLSACADEVGMSRIYGGIHYRFDNREGQRSGRLVADYVTAHTLLPNDQLPLVRVESVVGGRPLLCLLGQPGDSLVLEAGEDLVRWETIATATAELGGVMVSDERSSSAGVRFYRVRVAGSDPGP